MRQNLKRTVIVVDDDASVRRALCTHLRILGFGVAAFDSGEAVLAAALRPDDACLLVDVHLSGVSGSELCARLTAAGRQLPTILMSGADDPRTRRMMRDAGSRICLFKPFDETQLLRALRKAFKLTKS